MRVIIIEGIATSGKSTLIRLLKKHPNTQVFTEEQTHEPIMKNTANPNVEFFKSLLSQIDKHSELVVFDRLYLTQAFRANVGLDAYAEIESALQDYSPVTVFLKVDETAIAERVTRAVEHRHTSWGEYVKTKGDNPAEIAKYYIEQQRSQLELLKQSKLPHKVFNTTNHEYQQVADEIDRQ